MCLVEVKEFGTRPIKLEKIKKKKIEINIIFVLSFSVLIAIFSCCLISLNRFVKIIFVRDGDIKNVKNMNKRHIVIINQFISLNGRLILDLGSNDKKSLIL